MDNCSVSSEAIKFGIIAKEYLKVLDELKTRGLGASEAAEVAMTLLVNYFNFDNNNKFADTAASGLNFIPDNGDMY